MNFDRDDGYFSLMHGATYASLGKPGSGYVDQTFLLDDGSKFSRQLKQADEHHLTNCLDSCGASNLVLAGNGSGE